MKRLGLPLLALLLFAGCGPKINKDYKAIVDATIAEHAAGSGAKVSAPTTKNPQPWKVGQWSLYKITDAKGQPSFERVSVVGKDECGMWVETYRLDYYARNISKICFERMPYHPHDAEKAARKAVDLVRVMITKTDDNPAQTIDFRTSEGAGMKVMMQTMVQGMYFDWDFNENVPQDDITVPAGTFEKSYRTTARMAIAIVQVTSSGWLHPSVPVWGIVKMIHSSGPMHEVMAYGQNGAKSELP